MADIFSVIADPTRRDLLHTLLVARLENLNGTGEASVSELVEHLELSQPTVSKHLKVLRETGLVVVREEGQHRYYALEPEPLDAVGDWLSPFLELTGEIPEEDQFEGAPVLPDGVVGWARRVGETVAVVTHDVRLTAVELGRNIDQNVIEPLKETLEKVGDKRPRD